MGNGPVEFNISINKTKHKSVLFSSFVYELIYMIDTNDCYGLWIQIIPIKLSNYNRKKTERKL